MSRPKDWTARTKPCLICAAQMPMSRKKYCGTACAGTAAHLQSRASQARAYQDKMRGGDRLLTRTADCPDGHKWCARCQEFKPLDDFAVGRRGKRLAVANSYCKPCNADYMHVRRLRVTFGISAAEYWAMYDHQGGRCRICRRYPKRFLLAVDHDHANGRIRGLLCPDCNSFLGKVKDDPRVGSRITEHLCDPNPVLGDRRVP